MVFFQKKARISHSRITFYLPLHFCLLPCPSQPTLVKLLSTEFKWKDSWALPSWWHLSSFISVWLVGPHRPSKNISEAQQGACYFFHLHNLWIYEKLEMYPITITNFIINLLNALRFLKKLYLFQSVKNVRKCVSYIWKNDHVTITVQPHQCFSLLLHVAYADIGV